MKSGGFLSLLRANRNYRFAWVGQIVSEAGDNFNNVAVFSLALANTHSGLVVAAILLSRAASMLPAGPIAGVLLDRMDRRRIMLLSDLVRAVIALCFIFAIPLGRTWLLYSAKRHADVRLAVFHQRPRLYIADHRHPR